MGHRGEPPYRGLMNEEVAVIYQDYWLPITKLQAVRVVISRTGQYVKASLFITIPSQGLIYSIRSIANEILRTSLSNFT